MLWSGRSGRGRAGSRCGSHRAARAVRVHGSPPPAPHAAKGCLVLSAPSVHGGSARDHGSGRLRRVRSPSEQPEIEVGERLASLMYPHRRLIRNQQYGAIVGHPMKVILLAFVLLVAGATAAGATCVSASFEDVLSSSDAVWWVTVTGSQPSAWAPRGEILNVKINDALKGPVTVGAAGREYRPSAGPVMR